MSRAIERTHAKTPTRITMRVVESLKPGEIAWDSLVRGFAVRCQRARKVYILKANIAGRPRWFSIGEHGDALDARYRPRRGAGSVGQDPRWRGSRSHAGSPPPARDRG